MGMQLGRIRSLKKTKTKCRELEEILGKIKLNEYPLCQIDNLKNLVSEA